MPGFLDDYEPVEDRIRQFYSDQKWGCIRTYFRAAPEGEYIFLAEVYRGPDEEHPSATGWAHESVAQLPANMKASALEVCETSAIGRALANLGYAPKGKRPSREEIQASRVTTTIPEQMSARQAPSTSPPSDLERPPEHGVDTGAAPQPSEARSSDTLGGEGRHFGEGADPNPPALLPSPKAGPKDWAQASRELKTSGTITRDLVLRHLKSAYGVKSLEQIDTDLLRQAVSALVLGKQDWGAKP